MSFEVDRRGANNESAGRDPASHEPRIRKIADPDGKIEPFFDEVHNPIAEDRIYLHLCVPIEKASNHRAQVPYRKRGRDTQPEDATRRGLKR
ncbi:hypothetical protein [Bradyrhizobium sp. 149]|uniref:hypothetical protein n=1 Tax=Bradyrhizobium sp. 149 TaxID=2782624 RepID=UPI001FFA0A55|nr:hypothetical protein [Bradyrhizobium sp. 149]